MAHPRVSTRRSSSPVPRTAEADLAGHPGGETNRRGKEAGAGEGIVETGMNLACEVLSSGQIGRESASHAPCRASPPAAAGQVCC
jgi:hypothetical protein